jgi:arylsulfatase A-like enzyme
MTTILRRLVCLLSVVTVCSSALAEMNLVIIETDEHHFSTLGCYGGEIVKTPNIDWIAENGARCTSFYATTPVCSPSRAALVSGLYPHKTPVVTNNIPLDDSIITFAEILRRNGYATGYAGKWHLDGNGKPQWAPTRQFGFADNRFMYNRGHWKKFEDGPNGPRVGARDKKGKPSYGLAGADQTTFSTDWLCNKAIDFVKENKDRSFCYMVNLPDPHGPNTVRPPYDTMYADVKVPIPVSLVRKPEQIPKWGAPQGVKPAQLQKLMRQYYGMVKCIDDNVGRIIKTLRDQGVLDKTIVVFTSDHGDLCGEHGRLNKGVPYEGSARIPFLIYCPGKIKSGTIVDEALSNIDFLPTVMSLMQIPVEHKVDGRDATRLFTGQTPADWDDITFVRSTPRSEWLSAITQRYKLVISNSDEPWLIDVIADPNELTNLFGQAKHKQTARQLAQRLQDYTTTHKDPYGRIPRMKSWMEQVISGK